MNRLRFASVWVSALLFAGVGNLALAASPPGGPGGSGKSGPPGGGYSRPAPPGGPGASGGYHRPPPPGGGGGYHKPPPSGGYHGHGGYYRPGGYYGHGGHDHWSVGIYFDPFWYGPWYYPGPYYRPYYYPPAVVPVPVEPPVYVQRDDAAGTAPPASAYWYYCSDPQGYYPYVKQCKVEWQAVAPRPPEAPGEGR
jgi:hypothetical protein